MILPKKVLVMFFSSIAKFFSLSDILGDAINAIANGMLKFWRLIPIFR